jgi:PAS domain S-box-containing protein
MHNIIAAHKRTVRALWCLAKITEQAGEGIAVLDLNGTIQFVNATWTKMHGYNTRHELVGKQISAFHTKEQMERDVIPFIEEAKRRGQLTGPIEHMRKDGTPFFTEMKMTVVGDESGQSIGLISFVTDITERKRAEERLKQQTTELTATNEKLQQQVGEREQAETQWQGHRSQLEQRIEEQTTELTATNEKLQQQVGEREQAETQWQEHRSQLEQRIEEQTAELTAVNEKLQHEIAERDQREEKLRQHYNQLEEQIAELTAANEKLQQQVGQLEQSEETLLKSILEVEKPRGGAGRFDPQELRALSELAKHLA